MLREAIEEHCLCFDPTGRLRLHKGIAPKRPVVKPEPVWHIACRMPDLVTRTLVVTAAYTGIRIGELLGRAGAASGPATSWRGHGVPEAGTEFRGHDGHPPDGYGQALYSRTA